jgi:hypothetical protein
MTRVSITLASVFATVLVVLALAAGYLALVPAVDPAATASPAPTPSAVLAVEPHPSLLHGRVTTVGGATYEGRLRWGRDQEAFWGDYFNGRKQANPWAAHAPLERQPIEVFGIALPREIFGVEIGRRRVQTERPFMARFGDIVRIEGRGRDVRVTLKSGTVFDLDRFEAGDLDDGVRVWDARQGVVDLDSLQIRTVEFLAGAPPGAPPARLHGTVRSRPGGFGRFIQWNRQQALGSDGLDGRTDEGEIRLRFDALRSIARGSRESVIVTLIEGREIELFGARDNGPGHLGLYVDDPRYGRVLVSRDAFERVDFQPNGSGPAYGDFPPGRPLTGRVTTRAGRRLAGRLVYDLDESETTETLDAPSRGVDYTIPFGLIATIVPPGRDGGGARLGKVTLHNGEELQIEDSGDLGAGNAGLLVFTNGGRPEYVPWSEVGQIDLDRPSAMYPAVGGRSP